MKETISITKDVNAMLLGFPMKVDFNFTQFCTIPHNYTQFQAILCNSAQQNSVKNP